MFNRARNDWGYEGENLAMGVKPFKERKRTRFMDGTELPKFFKALAEAHPPELPYEEHTSFDFVQPEASSSNDQTETTGKN